MNKPKRVQRKNSNFSDYKAFSSAWEDLIFEDLALYLDLKVSPPHHHGQDDQANGEDDEKRECSIYPLEGGIHFFLVQTSRRDVVPSDFDVAIKEIVGGTVRHFWWV